MFETYHKSASEFFFRFNSKEGLSNYGQLIEITGPGGYKLLGFLIEKSVVVPLSSGPGSDPVLAKVITTNVMNLDERFNEIIPMKACHTLGLKYCGKTERIFSDVPSFGQIMAVHLHAEGNVGSQEDFVKILAESLNSVGSEFTIL